MSAIEEFRARLNRETLALEGAGLLKRECINRPVITHRLGVNDDIEGFEIMNSGRSGKVVLDWAAP